MLLLSACVLPRMAFKIMFPTGFPRVRGNLARQRQWTDYTFAFGLGRLFAASAAEELKPCAEFKYINMNDGANLAANPAFKKERGSLAAPAEAAGGGGAAASPGCSCDTPKQPLLCRKTLYNRTRKVTVCISMSILKGDLALFYSFIRKFSDLKLQL